MFLHFKKTAIAATVAVSILAAGGAYASRTKVSVPSSICKDKHRSFYRTDEPERTLAKIGLGRNTNEILAKWGDPASVTVGTKQNDNGPQGNPGGGPAYTPPAGANNDPYASLAAGVNAAANRLGANNPPPGANGGGLPPLPGMANPGGSAPAIGDPSAAAKSNLSEDEVCYTYKLKGKNPITLDFIINNGIVTQITASGNGSWPYSATRSGLMLGDSYALTLWVCGTPERQERNGKYLQVSYAQKNRVVYSFLNKKLVGVTIALMPDS